MRLPGMHPRAWLDSMLTYSRFLGTIKPELMAGAKEELAARLGLLEASSWPKRLEAPFAKRILAISPHPDDEAIGCGGLLLAHAGHAEIRIVNVYNGDGGGALAEGPWRDDPDYKLRLVAARAHELDLAAEQLHAAHVLRLGVSDCSGAPGPAEEAALRRELETFRPDVIVLPWLLDRHPHHRATNELLARAASGIDAMVLGYEIWGLTTPNAYLDITGLLEKKLEIIALYDTQMRTVDYVAFARGLASVRAFSLSVGARRDGAAEAYIALPCSDYCELVARGKPLTPP